MPGNTDGSATVRDARAKVGDVASLVATRQPQVVVLSVDGDVLVVLLGELLDGGLDVLHSSGLAHSLGGVVGVAPGTVPVALERLGVEGDDDAPLLGDAGEEITGHPKVVAHGDPLAGADLELPLGGHDLRVDTADIDLGVEASAVVGFDEITSENLAGS